MFNKLTKNLIHFFVIYDNTFIIIDCWTIYLTKQDVWRPHLGFLETDCFLTYRPKDFELHDKPMFWVSPLHHKSKCKPVLLKHCWLAASWDTHTDSGFCPLQNRADIFKICSFIRLSFTFGFETWHLNCAVRRSQGWKWSWSILPTHGERWCFLQGVQPKGKLALFHQIFTTTFITLTNRTHHFTVSWILRRCLHCDLLNMICSIYNVTTFSCSQITGVKSTILAAKIQWSRSKMEVLVPQKYIKDSTWVNIISFFPPLIRTDHKHCNKIIAWCKPEVEIWCLCVLKQPRRTPWSNCVCNCVFRKSNASTVCGQYKNNLAEYIVV